MQKVNESESEKFIPVARPCFSPEVVKIVSDVINSGWLATGPYSQKFEKDLAYYLLSYDQQNNEIFRTVLALTSGTAALFLALKAIGIKENDEVITTPLTFVSAVNAIALCGAKPVFVDIEEDSFNIDVTKVEEAITDRTKAILPMHYAGLPVDLDEIYNLSSKYELRVIEDAAHSMGAKYKSKTIGSFGDIQCFSFHPIKNMTTGEGGAISTNDKMVQRYVELHRFHGIDRSVWDRFSKNGKSDYDVVVPGFKYNISDIQAAIGIEQLSRLEDMNKKRRDLAMRYFEQFSECCSFWCQKRPSYDHIHAHHLFPICMRDSKKREELMKFLKSKNIGSIPYYSPVHLFTYYKDAFGYKVGDFEIAERVGSSILCIPLYPDLSLSEQDRVIFAIKEFFKNEK